MSVKDMYEYEQELFAETAQPIMMLIDDPDVTEIYVDSWNRISYQKHGIIEDSESVFDSPGNLSGFLHLMTKDIRNRSETGDNFFSLSSPEGHRFSIQFPDEHTDYEKYTMTIRLFRANEMSKDRMIELGAITESQYEVILEYLFKDKNVLISGKPSSGKTTLLRCLLNSINEMYAPRFVFLEDPKELNLKFKRGIEIVVDHKKQGSASEALRFCLRNSPQVMVLGEILDPDVARTFLESIEGGFSGAVSTIHSKNAEVATSRLATLAAKGSNISRTDWLVDANRTIDLVVYVSFNQVTGVRKVTELYDVQAQKSVNPMVESVD